MQDALVLPSQTAFDTAVNAFSRDLLLKHFAFAPGTSLCDAAGVSSEQVSAFSQYWHRLTLDRFMGDGGRYRFRRYSAFWLDSPGADFRVLAHHPYEQPTSVNPLNGGVKREFDPIEPAMLNEPALRAIVSFLAHSFDLVENAQRPWLVRLHPYRIYATKQCEGKPAPEGMHRDGVDYVTSVLINRENVKGGESTVATLDKQIIHGQTLSTAMDVLSCDDDAVLHGVSNLAPIDEYSEAWRDVLVVAFSRG